MRKLSSILQKAQHIKIEAIFKAESAQKRVFIHHDLLQLLNFSYGFKIGQIVPDDQVVLFQNDVEAIDDSSANTLIFFLHPITTAIKTINSIILRNESRAISKKYIIYFVPNISDFCMEEITRVNMKEKIVLKSFSFGLIPFNPGLISLQLSPHNHPVELNNICSDALLKLSKLCGRFKNIVGKGEKSRAILESYEKSVEEDEDLKSSENEACLIVLDRKIDIITPLMTGHSYQALLDHFFKIEYNRIMVPNRLLGGATNQLQKYLLHNPKDPIYEEIAYLGIQEAREIIIKRSSQLRAEIEMKRLNAKTQQQFKEVNKYRLKYQQVLNHKQMISEILERMNELHFYNLINIETNLVNESKTQLEELNYLTLEYSQYAILRILSLYSQVYSHPNFYKRFQKEILQIMVGNYSSKYIYPLYQLQKLGILRNSKIKSRWDQIKLQFDLIPDQPHSYTSTHITYSALSVRFIELILKNKLSPQLSSLLSKDNFIRGMDGKKQPKEVHIFFIGGVTYGEISCLKLLEKEMNITINILTTNVLNGDRFIASLIENSDL